MLTTLAFLVLAANPAAEQTTIPRQQDTQPYQAQDPAQGKPTDPLFDRKLVATDDQTFVRAAVENNRQGAYDARMAARDMKGNALGDTANAIGTLNETTARKLETLAKRKGWDLPKDNLGRQGSQPEAGPARARANFIQSQIRLHESTVAQYKAQIAGKGDAELKSTLKEALPGYERNLQRLLTTRP